MLLAVANFIDFYQNILVSDSFFIFYVIICFLNFSVFRYEVPNKKMLASMLNKKKGEVTNKVAEDIHSCTHVAITHDGWTSINTESFSTVTGNFWESIYC